MGRRQDGRRIRHVWLLPKNSPQINIWKKIFLNDISTISFTGKKRKRISVPLLKNFRPPPSPPRIRNREKEKNGKKEIQTLLLLYTPPSSEAPKVLDSVKRRKEEESDFFPFFISRAGISAKSEEEEETENPEFSFLVGGRKERKERRKDRKERKRGRRDRKSPFFLPFLPSWIWLMWWTWSPFSFFFFPFFFSNRDFFWGIREKEEENFRSQIEWIFPQKFLAGTALTFLRNPIKIFFAFVFPS